MNRLIKIFAILTCFFQISCLDVVEEVDFNEDLSGKVRYTVNLSKSATKIKALTKLDTIFGKKIPTPKEIEQKFEDISNKMKAKKGITNVRYELDFDQHIYQLEVNFNSIQEYNAALAGLKSEFSREVNALTDFYKLDKNLFIKTIPKFDNLAKHKNQIERRKEDLKTAFYTYIVRSKKEMRLTENSLMKLSKNKKGALYRSNLYSLISLMNQNQQLKVKL